MNTPVKSYFLCSSPRSGSGYLCSVLQQTNSLGIVDEWINAKTELLWRSDPENFLKYIIETKQSSNGVLGLKVHFQEFFMLFKSQLFKLFENPFYIYLSRNDKLAQAISYSKALQQDWWNTEDASGPLREAHYDYNHIRDCLSFILDQEIGWETFFASVGIKPLRLFYERMVLFPKETCIEISNYLNVQIEDIVDIQDRLSPQKDHINLEWNDRFLDDSKRMLAMPSLEGFIGLEHLQRWDPSDNTIAMYSSLTDYANSKNLINCINSKRFIPHDLNEIIRKQHESGLFVQPFLSEFGFDVLSSHISKGSLSGYWRETSNPNYGITFVLDQKTEILIFNVYSIEKGSLVFWYARLILNPNQGLYSGFLKHAPLQALKGMRDGIMSLLLSKFALEGTVTPIGEQHSMKIAFEKL